MATTGTKINLAKFIVKKMLKIFKEKEKGSLKQEKENRIILISNSVRDSHHTLCKVREDFAT